MPGWLPCATEEFGKQALVRQISIREEHQILWVSQPVSCLRQQHPRQIRRSGPDLAFDDELASGINDGEIPGLFDLLTDKAMQVMEALKVNASKSRELRRRRAVAVSECGGTGEAGAVGEVINDVVNLRWGQFASPVGRPPGFAELGVARAAPEETTFLRTVELAELDVLAA